MDWERYQILALAAVLEKRQDYLFRKICRDYSGKFFTPLHEVHKLPFHFVLTNWMESSIENMDENTLSNLSRDIVGIDESEEQLIQEQIDMWEKEFKTNKDKKKPTPSEIIDFEEKALDFSDLKSED